MKLLAAFFTVHKWLRLILHDEYSVSPVEPSKVVLQANPTTGHPGAPWERALAQLHVGRESDLIDVHEVFCMTDL